MEQQIDRILQKCTVKLAIPGQSGWGTGVFVAPGLILTCAHVVRNANESIRVSWQNQENFAEASIEQIIPEPFDLALLRFNPPPGIDLPCVYLGNDIEPGDKFYIFGYPDDFPNGAPVVAKCEGLTGDTPPLLKFQGGQIRPGLSGSPLLNQRTGAVVGIVKFTRDRSLALGGGALPTQVITQTFPQLESLQKSFHEQNQQWPKRSVTETITADDFLNKVVSISIYDLLQECTVKLAVPGQSGWGTGVFVAPGLILTCAHVVREANESTRVSWQNQQNYAEASIEQIIPESDLALLKFNPPPGIDLPCIYLDDELVQFDESLYSFGYSDDFACGSPVIGTSEGITTENPPLIKFKGGQIRPGFSGAPLLNRRTKKVCGIVKATLNRSSDLGGLALPSTFILEQLPELQGLQQHFHQKNHVWIEHLDLMKVDAKDILEQISVGNTDRDDINILTRLLRTDSNEILQTGKYNISISEGTSIHIGDTFIYERKQYDELIQKLKWYPSECRAQVMKVYDALQTLEAISLDSNFPPQQLDELQTCISSLAPHSKGLLELVEQFATALNQDDSSKHQAEIK